MKIKLIRPNHEILTDINNDILLKLERAARTCYKSEDKITEGSARKLISALIKSGHHSVIEHESVSVKIICDRGITHEIVRHRLCSFSQESTRYCNYKDKFTYIIPFWYLELEPITLEAITMVDNFTNYNVDTIIWLSAILSSSMHYTDLIKTDHTPQQARSVLPNSLKTEIIVTANVREWRHIFSLRCDKASHPQMREVMLPLLKEFHNRIPVIFDDIYERFEDEIRGYDKNFNRGSKKVNT